jgi:hypothetical protein
MSNPLIITIIGWIVCIFAGYFLFLVIVPFFIIPNLAPFSTKPAETEKLRHFARQFESKEKKETLRKAYEFMVKDYTGVEDRHKVVILAHKTFMQNVEKIIEDRNQFLHCHVSNRVLMTILINTGQFDEGDFEKKLEISDFGTIHQYLIVKIGKKKYKVDIFYRIFEEIKCTT